MKCMQMVKWVGYWWSKKESMPVDLLRRYRFQLLAHTTYHRSNFVDPTSKNMIFTTHDKYNVVGRSEGPSSVSTWCITSHGWAVASGTHWWISRRFGRYFHNQAARIKWSKQKTDAFSLLSVCSPLPRRFELGNLAI